QAGAAQAVLAGVADVGVHARRAVVAGHGRALLGHLVAEGHEAAGRRGAGVGPAADAGAHRAVVVDGAELPVVAGAALVHGLGDADARLARSARAEREREAVVARGAVGEGHLHAALHGVARPDVAVVVVEAAVHRRGADAGAARAEAALVALVRRRA